MATSCVDDSARSPVVVMAANCPVVSATIWSVPKAAQSSVVSPAMLAADRLAIWVVVRFGMLVAISEVLCADQSAVGLSAVENLRRATWPARFGLCLRPVIGRGFL